MDAAEDDDIAGYSWSLEYLASPAELAAIARSEYPEALEGGKVVPSRLDLNALASDRFEPSKPRPAIMTRENSVSFSNADNGLYAFSVSAIDSVGNVGEPEIRYIVLNKYIPYTTITRVDSTVDEFGEMTPFDSRRASLKKEPYRRPH